MNEVPGSGAQGVYKILTEIKQQVSNVKAVTEALAKNEEVVVEKPAAPKPTTAVQIAETKIDGFVKRSIKQFQMTLADPVTLVLLSVVFFAAYTHHYNADESMVKKFVAKLKEREALKPLGDWIDANIPKFFGIIMSIAASSSLKESIRYSTMVLSGIVIMMLPTTTVSFYSITVSLSLLYVRLKVKSDKFIVVGIMLFIYAYYFIETKPDNPIPGPVKNNATSKETTKSH